MTDAPRTVVDLRALMAAAEDVSDRSGAGWNARRDAQQMLANWRVWLPGFLDAIEAQCAVSPAFEILFGGMTQAEAEARGLL